RGSRTSWLTPPRRRKAITAAAPRSTACPGLRQTTVRQWIAGSGPTSDPRDRATRAGRGRRSPGRRGPPSRSPPTTSPRAARRGGAGRRKAPPLLSLNSPCVRAHQGSNNVSYHARPVARGQQSVGTERLMDTVLTLLGDAAEV